MNKAVLTGGNIYAAHKELSELFDDGCEMNRMGSIKVMIGEEL